MTKTARASNRFVFQSMSHRLTNAGAARDSVGL
jgi:hypothetical protein